MKKLTSILFMAGFATISFAADTTATATKAVTTKEFSHNCLINALKVAPFPQSVKITAVEVDLKECALEGAPANTFTSAKAYIQEKTPFRDSMLINLTDAMKANKRIELNVQNITLVGGVTIPTVTGMNIPK